MDPLALATPRFDRILRLINEYGRLKSWREARLNTVFSLFDIDGNHELSSEEFFMIGKVVMS